MKTRNALIACFACLLFGLIIGFFSGRKTLVPIVKTEVKTGAPVFGSVRIDTFYISIPTDTAAIVADYLTRHDFSYRLFDNQYGKLDVALSTQFNRPLNIDYTYHPLYTVQTVERRRAWTPFVSAGYNSMGYVGVGGGVFYNNIGVGLQYSTDLNRKGIGVGLMYKF